MRNFDQIFSAYLWKPIVRCPGRWVFAEVGVEVSDIVGARVSVAPVTSVSARDAIVHIPVEGGGIISYQRSDGSYVHTLCTQCAYLRKLAMLGLP